LLPVHSSIAKRYFENKWTNYDANWHKWSPRQAHETIQLWGSGSRRSVSHKAKIGHKFPLWRDISRRIWQILTKAGRHITINVTGNRNWDASRSREAADRVWGLTEALFSTQSDQVGFLVWSFMSGIFISMRCMFSRTLEYYKLKIIQKLNNVIPPGCIFSPHETMFLLDLLISA